LVLSSTQWHYSGQACLDVGHMSVLDTDLTLTFIITLNCIIFSNYYWCRCIGVRVVSCLCLCSIVKFYPMFTVNHFYLINCSWKSEFDIWWG
jgi:hypothetical protein